MKKSLLLYDIKKEILQKNNKMEPNLVCLFDPLNEQMQKIKSPQKQTR